ncbi:MAG: hypothetical protein HC933_12200 [Pleurocapsa sp. SU_196_0]|nr:hypothetical protein [Pleurocapsa sp. SU_196_0]
MFAAVLVPISLIRLLWTIRADLRSLLERAQPVPPRDEVDHRAAPAPRDLVVRS